MSYTPPGWYRDAAGQQRWWDGYAWGTHAAAVPARRTMPVWFVVAMALVLVAAVATVGVVALTRGGAGASSAASPELISAVQSFTTTPRTGTDAEDACLALAEQMETAAATVEPGTLAEDVWQAVAASIVDDTTAAAAMTTDQALNGYSLRADAAAPAAVAAGTSPASFGRVSALAQGGTALCGADEFKVYFVNGVWNTIDDATALNLDMGRILGVPSQLVYNFSFRQTADYRYEMCRRALDRAYPYAAVAAPNAPDTDPFYGDPEAWNQWLDGEIEAVTAQVSNGVRGALSGACRGIDSLANNAEFTFRAAWHLVAGAAQTVFQRVADLDVASEEVNGALVPAIRQDLLSGRRVVIIGHSQGTLFARNALGQLQEWFDSMVGQPNGFPEGSVMPVAALYISPAFSPDAAANQQYVQLSTDGLRGSSLAAATHEPTDAQYGSNPVMAPVRTHELLTYLMEGTPTRAAIEQHFAALSAYVEAHKVPPVAAGGPIQATLTWSAPNDVDLYATEPDGTVVYFRAPVGTSGSLDVDDTTGTGPENYRVLTCEDLQPGTYTFGVNYYAASTDPAHEVTATVTVTAGGQTASRHEVLWVPDGGGTIVPMLTVTVESDATDPENVEYRLRIGSA